MNIVIFVAQYSCFVSFQVDIVTAVGNIQTHYNSSCTSLNMCYLADSSHVYKLEEMRFTKASLIDPPLLKDVIRRYKERQIVCRNCYYGDFKLLSDPNTMGQCKKCHRESINLLVMPKSPMTVNFYESNMIAIPPWPKSKPNNLPFESCAKPKDKSNDHKRCLIMSRNSPVWYAHTVEELVIWTVEREYLAKWRMSCS